ncbi:unnamed protein product, partial [Didymodactylos carnosus]
SRRYSVEDVCVDDHGGVLVFWSSTWLNNTNIGFNDDNILMARYDDQATQWYQVETIIDTHEPEISRVQWQSTYVHYDQLSDDLKVQVYKFISRGAINSCLDVPETVLDLL